MASQEPLMRAFQRFITEHPELVNTSAPPTPTPASRGVVQQDAENRTVQAPRIAQRYESARAPGPMAPLAPPPSYQAMVGFQALAPSAPSINGIHANQQPQSLSTAGSPRSATSNLVVRNRRARGPARARPVLPNRPDRHVPTINHCLVDGAEVPTGNILVLVYPHSPPTCLIMSLIAFFTQTSWRTLTEEHLAYRYVLPLSTLVNDLASSCPGRHGTIARSLHFSYGPSLVCCASESVTALQLLRLHDRGRLTNNNAVRLDLEPHTWTPTSSTWDLIPSVTLTGALPARPSVQYVTAAATLVSAFTSTASSRLTTLVWAKTLRRTSGGEEVDGGPRRSRRGCFGPFRPQPHQSCLVLPPVAVVGLVPTLAACPAQTRLPQARLAPPAPRPTPRPLLRTLRATPSATFPSAPRPVLAPVRSHPSQSSRCPPSIWVGESTYNPTSRGDFGPIASAHDVMAAASIDDAVRSNDFTQLLNPDRFFELTNDMAVGDGVEREVVHAALQRFLNEEPVWFDRGENNQLILRTLFSSGSSSFPVPAARIQGFARLGALCGLQHVYGQAPQSISVAIFQYIINHCNLDALSQQFCGEWFADLRHLILSFLATPETEDLRAFQAHLVTFHNVDPAAYRIRDLATHRALGVNMLYRPTVANDTFDKPELAAFRDAYLLPCRNGFTLGWAIRNFEGGTETFLSVVATSHISSADTLLAVLDIVNPPNLAEHIDRLRGLTTDATLTFHMMIERFLRGVGIPCENMFAASTGAFHPVVDLTRIHTPGFRAQMLAWAATGSPFVDAAGGRISLGPVNTHGEGYGIPGSTAAEWEVLAREGTFHVQTCHRSARFPVEYALRLAEVQYVPEGEPGDFQEAFDFWFLTQCLIAIGRHNMM
ncbi:hypothetical protein R3P38DRAFT_3202196 [Favolaschia claudopus]|uniref:Uncharacterized protein n=1 Tax=Favolaschia claudopus TaxID=2862362 RepID=A0AAW0ATW9_9AGAR